MLFCPAPPWYEMPQCDWCLLMVGNDDPTWVWLQIFYSSIWVVPSFPQPKKHDMRQFYHACTQPIANVLGMGTIQRTYGQLWTCSIWIWFSHLPIQHGGFPQLFWIARRSGLNPPVVPKRPNKCLPRRSCVPESRRRGNRGSSHEFRGTNH